MKRGYTLGVKKMVQNISPINHVKLNIIKISFEVLLIVSFTRYLQYQKNAAKKSIKLTGCPAKILVKLWINPIKLPDSSPNRLSIPSEADWSQYLERKILLAKGKNGFSKM